MTIATADLTQAPTGRLAVRIWRNGRLIEDFEGPNMVVIGSQFIAAQLLGGTVTGNTIQQAGFGSNLTPASFQNNSLSVDAYYKSIDGVTFPATNQVTFALSLGAYEANGNTLAEYGLITGSGMLFARLVRSATLIKDISVTLNALWTISY